MRGSLVALAAALAFVAAPASAQQAQVFRCDDGGNAFYYRVGPGEFRNWVASGNGYPARWLDNQCNTYTECTWQNGVFSMYTPSIGWLQQFDTRSGEYLWGEEDDYPTRQQCTAASDPPPA
ncbi:MAG: hypothetical protein ACT4OF_12395 [Caulobacteraceae bacterium]